MSEAHKDESPSAPPPTHAAMAPQMAWPGMTAPGMPDPALFAQMQQQMALQMQMLQMMQQQMAMAGVQPMMQIPSMASPPVATPAQSVPPQTPSFPLTSVVEHPIVAAVPDRPMSSSLSKTDKAPSQLPPATTPASIAAETTTSLPRATSHVCDIVTDTIAREPAASHTREIINPFASKPPKKGKEKGKDAPPPTMFCEFCEHYSHTIDQCWYRQRKLKEMMKEEKLAAAAAKKGRAPESELTPVTTPRARSVREERKDSRLPKPSEQPRTKATAPKRARSPPPARDRSNKSRARSRSPSYVDYSDSAYSYSSDDDYESDYSYDSVRSARRERAPKSFEGRVVEMGNAHPAAVIALIKSEVCRRIYLRQLFDHMIRVSLKLWRPKGNSSAIRGGLCPQQRSTIDKVLSKNGPAEEWHTEADRWMARTVALILTITSQTGCGARDDPTYKACLGAVTRNLKSLEPREGEVLEGFWGRIYSSAAADLKISLTPPNGQRNLISANRLGGAFIPEFDTSLGVDREGRVLWRGTKARITEGRRPSGGAEGRRPSGGAEGRRASGGAEGRRASGGAEGSGRKGPGRR